MKLPSKDDPLGDKEGELPLFTVLAVLKENDVSVMGLGGDLYLLSDAHNEILESQCFPTLVGGLMVRRLARKFEIETMDFYYCPKTGARRYEPPENKGQH